MADSTHVLTCTRIKGVTAVYRHNIICAAMASFLTTIGLVVSHEPRFYDYPDGSKRRPDLTVHKFPQALVCDVTVTNAPELAVTAKASKHGEAAASRGHIFFPFVLGTWGDFHPCCDTFVSSALDGFPPSTRKILRLKFYKRLADAFAEGTATMLAHFIAHPPHTALLSSSA